MANKKKKRSFFGLKQKHHVIITPTCTCNTRQRNEWPHGTESHRNHLVFKDSSVFSLFLHTVRVRPLITTRPRPSRPSPPPPPPKWPWSQTAAFLTMALAEPHANLDRHTANIDDMIEKERASMESAEYETRLATRRWRDYTVWLAQDSKKHGVSKARFSRRKEKAKLVWWASKKAVDWRAVAHI